MSFTVSLKFQDEVDVFHDLDRFDTADGIICLTTYKDSRIAVIDTNCSQERAKDFHKSAEERILVVQDAKITADDIWVVDGQPL